MRVRRVWLDNPWVGRCLVGRCPVCGLFLACASFLFYPFLATSLTRRASFGHRQWEPLGDNHMNPNSLSESYSLSLFLTLSLSLFHSQSLSLSLSLSCSLSLSLRGWDPFFTPSQSAPQDARALALAPPVPSPQPTTAPHALPGGRSGLPGRRCMAGVEGGGGGSPGSWDGARKQPKVCRSLSLSPNLPSSLFFSDSVYGCLFL